MKEKYVWEVQLRNLGGPNYGISTGKVVDDDGREVPGQRGYRYYGRARELPGIPPPTRIHPTSLYIFLFYRKMWWLSSRRKRTLRIGKTPPFNEKTPRRTAPERKRRLLRLQRRR